MAIADLVYIDATGYHFPDYPTVLTYFTDEYKRIYGADIVLSADSQDGQWIAILAQAAYDTMALGASVYNSFSPATAVGVGLDRGVAINGINRRVPTNSTVDLDLVGTAGTTITNGQVKDTLGQTWNLPASVVIGISGAITVTATAAVAGAITAASGTVTQIATPTRGWLSATNAADATPGTAVESDAELRVRQQDSTALPSLSVLDGTIGAVADVVGVTDYRGYENDSNVTDSDGIPAHSISIVVEGGDAQDIGDAIARHKTPGTGTYGTTAVTTYDRYGNPNVINFYRPTLPAIKVNITLDALTGFTSGYEDDIKASVAAYINSIGIGNDVQYTKIFTPANLNGSAIGATYDITVLEIAKNAGSFGTTNIVIAFNERADCDVADITITVV